MVKLTFYGAVGQIGGVATLLQDQDTSMFQDMGLSFDNHMAFNLSFMGARKYNAITDLIKMGIAPDLGGLYRRDYEQHEGREIQPTSIDGIVLSHYHLDHAWLLNFVRPEIPVFMSKESFIGLKIYEEASSARFKEYTKIKLSNKFVPKPRGPGFKKLTMQEIPRNIQIVEDGVPFKVNNLTTTCHYVDHSIPGCFGTITETSIGNVVYTGDIRKRGRHGDLTDKFIQAAADSKPEILIAEGTRIGEGGNLTEEDIFQKGSEILSDIEGLGIVEFPVRDIDRLHTFYRIAKATGRTFLVSPYHAYLLDQYDNKGDFGYKKIRHKHMGVFLRRKGSGLLDRAIPDYITNQDELVENDYFPWEKQFIKNKDRVSIDELVKNPEQYLLYHTVYNFYTLNDLDLRGAIYFRSITEPYDDRSEQEDVIRMNWLERLELPWHQLHISGHMTFGETEDMIKRINPEIVIPLHTMYPETFEKIHDNVVHVETGKMIEFS